MRPAAVRSRTPDYANDLLRRLAGQQENAPFASSVLRLLDELEEARATACRMENEVARLNGGVNELPEPWTPRERFTVDG